MQVLDVNGNADLGIVGQIGKINKLESAEENQSKLSAPNLLDIIENFKRTKEELDRVLTQ